MIQQADNATVTDEQQHAAISNSKAASKK